MSDEPRAEWDRAGYALVAAGTAGKNFGLYGVRLGCLVANPALASRIRAMLPRWNLNSLGPHVVFMLREYGAEYRRSIGLVRRDRAATAGHLTALPGLTVYPSQGNFLFVRLPVGAEGTVARDRLLTGHRILVRECGDKIGSSSRFLRLVVRPEVDVRRLVPALRQVLYDTEAEAAATGPAAATAYSSGTAAVDRLFRGRTQPEPPVPAPAPQPTAWPGAGGSYGRTG